MNHDGQLLRRYLRDGDEPSFRELVHRHLDMVHATATRRLRDPHAANDVSQAVFCLLVRKAAGLFDLADLGGWLHRATCWKAAEFERSERRRRIREQASATLGEAMTPASPDEVWDQLAPALDASLDRLDDGDRQLILWRFYRRRSLKEIGNELQVTEDAARMRVNRALERLRRLLAPSAGAALAGTASTSRAGVSLEALLLERVIQKAPTDLANRILAAAAGTRESGAFLPEALRSWPSLLGWRGALLGGAGALVVAWTVLRLAQGAAESSPEDRPALEAPGANSAPAHVIAQTAASRFGSARQVGGQSSAPDPSEGEDHLAPLWRILNSPVPDLSFPPNDLRGCIAGLADHAEAVLEALAGALNDPASSVATRERAMWGLWLLGEAAPAVKSRIVPIAVGFIVNGEPRHLRTHASHVLAHLSIPEGSVGALGVALQAHPECWQPTLSFWEGAARQRPNEVRKMVTPWLQRTDALRFLAASTLARLPHPSVNELAPILLEGIPNGEQQDAALRALLALGPSAREVAPRLAEMLRDANQPGKFRLREGLIKVLAEVDPESRHQWPEVDQYLTEKAPVEAFHQKLASNTATLEDLIGGLQRNQTSWRAALELQELGPKAAEALPALREALDAPDPEHASYLADAIKAIDPSSPKPLFQRDDLIPALRALSDVAKEVAPNLRPEDQETLTEFIERTISLPPERLVEWADRLEVLDPRLRRAWVVALVGIDPALASKLPR